MYEDGLPPIRDVISQYDLNAKKALGQNFLTDLNLTSKIARSAGNLTDAVIYEVGPGPGALTRGLLMNGAKKVIAVEMDHRCISALQDVENTYKGKLSIYHDDALKIDEQDLIKEYLDGPVHIVANLPYNVGTALLVKWMTNDKWMPWFKSLTLMFQKEVGERIVAKPNTKAYGRLSILCQYRADVDILFDIPARAFTPPPKVTSCIVQITPRMEENNAPNQKILEKLVSAAFNQRRKMLRSSLKSMGVDPVSKLAAAGIKETARAEELSVADFCRLAKEYENN